MAVIIIAWTNSKYPEKTTYGHSHDGLRKKTTFKVAQLVYVYVYVIFLL